MSDPSVNDIPDSELVRRVIRSIARNTARDYLWVRVMVVFGLDSTYATQLCIKHGFDPEQTKYVEPTYGLATKEPTQ